MIYWQLFLSFLQIGALSFGGGYAAMPLIESQIVTSHSWLTMTEFANLVTIAEMTPGPIAVNAATFVGTKIGGVPGALVQSRPAKTALWSGKQQTAAMRIRNTHHLTHSL